MNDKFAWFPLSMFPCWSQRRAPAQRVLLFWDIPFCVWHHNPAKMLTAVPGLDHPLVKGIRCMCILYTLTCSVFGAFFPAILLLLVVRSEWNAFKRDVPPAGFWRRWYQPCTVNDTIKLYFSSTIHTISPKKSVFLSSGCSNEIELSSLSIISKSISAEQIFESTALMSLSGGDDDDDNQNQSRAWHSVGPKSRWAAEGLGFAEMCRPGAS